MDQAIDINTFSPYLDQRFRIHFEEQPTDAELIKVEKIGKGDATQGESVPFSLLFQTAPDPVYGQGNYRVVHEALGETLIFLVPIGPCKDGMCYEAVFS